MTSKLIKSVLGAAAVMAVATFTLAPSAQASCFWGPYGWQCSPVNVVAPASNDNPNPAPAPDHK